MPYVHLGTNSIFWSQYSYDGASWAASQKDPTNIVVWKEADQYDFDDRLRTDTSTLWQDDDGQFCPAAVQYVAMKNHSTYSWTWKASNGLQKVGDLCAFGERTHVRFWSLNDWDPDFAYWTVASAHFEQYHSTPWPGHDVLSWEVGETAVENSFKVNGTTLLPWVDGVVNQSFGNAGGSPYNDGVGVLIEVSQP